MFFFLTFKISNYEEHKKLSKFKPDKQNSRTLKVAHTLFISFKIE